MDILIHRDELVRALARAQGIVEKRPTQAILSAVLLQTTAEGLRATATDKTMTVIGDYAATVRSAGEVAVDANNFFQIAKVLSGDVVSIKVIDNGRLEVKAGASVFKLATFNAADFPVTPAVDQARTLTMESEALRRVIDRVHFAVAPDDNRYGLNGAHVEDTTVSQGAVVRFVGTDGNRLCWAQAPYQGELGIGKKMLLPRKGLGEIRKLIEGYDGDVQIAFGDRAAVVQYPGVLVHLRLLEADFPDYRQVLPASFKRRVIVERDALREALRRVSVLATDATNSVRFQFGPDGLQLSARKADTGDGKEDVQVELQGEPISMGFNARFVIEVLSAMQGSRVALELGEALAPCILRDLDDDNALFVVMPVRLD
jgi:DNA polymerase-3 subunit beta